MSKFFLLPTLILTLLLILTSLSFTKENNFDQKSFNLKQTNKNKQQGPSINQIKELFTRLQAEQYQGTTDFVGFEFIKGLYSSEIKINQISDKESLNWFGENAAMPDNNMFVTSFVLFSLVECQNLGTIDVDEDYLMPSIDALLQFRNKNQEEGIPMYNFWEQEEKDGVWISYPQNIFAASEYIKKLPATIRFLLKKYFGITSGLIDSMASAFIIPPDNDDTGINIVLGQLFQQNRKQYPNINDKWDDENYDFVSLYQEVQKYNYEPFNEDFNKNSIDPRTYYYLQGFIQEEIKNAKEEKRQPSLNLFTTWITNIQDQQFGYVKMPFSVNNVDMTVNANSLFGLASFLLTSSDLEQIMQIYNSETSQIINNVTDLLVWGIENEIAIKRPDLSLTYYPSIYNFYWFVARLENFLQGYDNIQFQELEQTKQKLQNVLQTKGTQQMLDLSIKDKSGNIYWESFLGNYSDPKKHTDRAFSTTMALNTLIDIWTTQYEQGTLQYKKNTPQEVKDTITNSINYLSELLNDKKTPLGNAFFSGSVKTDEDLPFWYPANSVYMYNYETGEKTMINPEQPKKQDNISKKSYKKPKTDDKTETLIDSVSGVIDEKQYQDWVENYTWFGEDVPTEFAGFNQKDSPFPYWSSNSITLSFSMLAMSKYLNIK